jgi:hypothetical protein
MSFNQWAPEYANGLSNHLPMAIEALLSMQATADQIDRYHKAASTKLEILSSQEPEPIIENWQDAMKIAGQFKYYLSLRSFFDRQIASDPKNPIIAVFIKRLAPALSCAAFHPLIRLAHAISAKNCDEIASAFAYWVYAYKELTWPNNALVSSSSLSQTITSLLDDHPWPTGRLGDFMVTVDMMRVREQTSFERLNFKPDSRKINLEEIEESILNLYLASDDFTVLHGVTGTYAVRVLLEHFPNIDNLLIYLWQGLVTAFLSKGLNDKSMQHTLCQLNDIKIKTCEAIRHNACHSLDDHTIKLAAVCLEMHHRTRNQDYLLAISRKLLKENANH